MTVPRIVLALLLLGLPLPGSLLAQSTDPAEHRSWEAGAPDGAFGHLTLAIGAGGSTLGNPFGRYLSPGTAVHVSLTAPMLGGRMRAGIYGDRVRSTRDSIPGYSVLAPYLEWGPAVRLGPTEWTVGLGAGAYRMLFEREHNPDEMEMALVGGAEMALDLGGGWRVGVRGHLRRALMHENLDQPILTVEVGRRWRTGSRVRRVLVGDEDGAGEAAALPDLDAPAEVAAERLLPDPLTGRRVIQGSSIRALGANDLTDLLARLPDWDVSTVNLRTWWASPKGLSSWDDQGWDVWLDGVPLSLEVMGLTTFDRMGVPLSAVDSVVVVSVPGLHGGAFSDRGRIHVHTRTPRRPFGLRAEGYMAQPTGDPGPLHDPENEVHNVDRLGTGEAMILEGAVGPLSATVGYTAMEGFYTDAGPGASDRIISVRDLREKYPVVRTFTARASVRLDTEVGRHVLVLGRALRGDLVHHPDVSLEFPARNTHRAAGLSGTFDGLGGADLSYRGSWARNGLEAAPGEVDFARDLELSERDAAAWAHGAPGRWRWSVGAGASRHEERFERDDRGVADGPESVSTTLRSFGSLGIVGPPEFGGRPAWGAFLEVESAWVDGAPAPKAALRGEAAVGDASFAGTLAWVRVQGREERGLWPLWTRGFGLPGARGLAPTPGPGLEEGGTGAPPRELGSLDFEARVPLGAVALRVFLDGRRFDGVLLAEPRFEMTGGGAIPAPLPPTPVVSAGGDVVGAGVELAGVMEDKRVEARLHYRWRDAVGGDAAFLAAWDRVPAHLGQGWVRVEVPSAVTLHGRLESWSVTRWSRFGSEGIPLRLPGAAEVELGAAKAFWEERFRVGLAVSDVLDRDARRSPLGASPGLSFRVHGSMRVGG